MVTASSSIVFRSSGNSGFSTRNPGNPLYQSLTLLKIEALPCPYSLLIRKTLPGLPLALVVLVCMQVILNGFRNSVARKCALKFCYLKKLERVCRT